MMTPTHATRSPRPSSDRRAIVRHLAAVLCGIVALLYLTLLFLVADAESGAPENTYGAYLLLAVPYLAGAGLLVVVDHRALWAAGVVVQVAVLVLFLMFGAGLFGPGQGVFDYDALSDLHMGWWSAVITSVEVVLLGLLAYLAFARGSIRHDVGA